MFSTIKWLLRAIHHRGGSLRSKELG